MTWSRSLGGLAVVLGLMLAWVLMAAPDDQPIAADPRPSPIQARDAAGPDLGVVGDLAATVLARPLFSPDRRLAPPGQAAPSAVISDDIPRLAAIIVGPAGGLAIFEDDTGHPRVAAQGDSVGRFKVGAIAPGQVLLLTSEGERVLRPKYANPAGTPVAEAAGLAGSRQ